MWAAGLACVLALLCVWAAVCRGRRLRKLEDGRAFKDRMGRGSLARLRKLRGQVDHGPGRELLEAVLEARSERQAIAELNAVVGELKFELSGAHEVARSGGRIALAGGGMLAAVQLIQFLQGGATLASALVCLTAGLAAGLLCTALARSAQSRARAQMEAWGQVTRRLSQISRDRFASSGGEA